MYVDRRRYFNSLAERILNFTREKEAANLIDRSQIYLVRK